MSATMKPGVRYRMPTVFGPAPGPRQKADGTPWTLEETGTMNCTWFAVTYRTDRAALEALLPPGFELRGEPEVSVCFSDFRNLYWLAGRGYGILIVDDRRQRVLASRRFVEMMKVPDDILADKHVFVMPDILANAGGVTASYFEWVQDRQGYFWKESVVNEQLEHIMVSSFEDVVRYAETHKVNNRIAAYMLAIDRVAYTIRQRGIYA